MHKAYLRLILSKCQLKFVIIFKPCLISHNSTLRVHFCDWSIYSKNKMENFTDDTDKRKRSSNWDSSEISLLRQLVQDNMSTLRNKLTNYVTNSRKNSIWKDIAVQINSLGLHHRTDKEVKQNGKICKLVQKAVCRQEEIYYSNWRWTSSQRIEHWNRKDCRHDERLFKFCWSPGMWILNKFNRRCQSYYRYFQYLKKQLIFVYSDVTKLTNSDLYFVKQMLGPQRLNIRMHIFIPC